MFEVGVVRYFEAAHRLRGNFGPATRLHGHTYKVEAALRGDVIDGQGVLYDVGALQKALEQAVQPLHYRDLDEIDGLRGQNTTAEVVAKYLHDDIVSRLSPCPHGLRITVWESESVYARYEGAKVSER